MWKCPGSNHMTASGDSSYEWEIKLWSRTVTAADFYVLSYARNAERKPYLWKGAIVMNDQPCCESFLPWCCGTTPLARGPLWYLLLFALSYCASSLLIRLGVSNPFDIVCFVTVLRGWCVHISSHQTPNFNSSRLVDGNGVTGTNGSNKRRNHQFFFEPSCSKGEMSGNNDIILDPPPTFSFQLPNAVYDKKSSCILSS